MYTEESNKIVLGSNYDKRLQIYDKTTTYPYGSNTYKVWESEMMIMRDYFVENYADFPIYDKIILQQRKYKWSTLVITQMKTYVPYIPNPPHRILIIGGSESRKTNVLLNLINNQPDIDKIYLYVKDPYEAKYQFLINKRENIGLKHYNDPKAFIEYSNDMQDV